ncbi:hypothetical protein [Aureimonas sp. Leaf427]|uniref:hypothetical protein n=1 Tax=Aureimonas sp. Leaf427 TaxID=1736375 RepID=UPI000AD5CB50|nr:hypothetical protein [Aureimonas sp. Leaf427]
MTTPLMVMTRSPVIVRWRLHLSHRRARRLPQRMGFAQEVVAIGREKADVLSGPLAQRSRRRT